MTILIVLLKFEKHKTNEVCLLQIYTDEIDDNLQFEDEEGKSDNEDEILNEMEAELSNDSK